jgi:hypothetical protein
VRRVGNARGRKSVKTGRRRFEPGIGVLGLAMEALIENNAG